MLLHAPRTASSASCSPRLPRTRCDISRRREVQNRAAQDCPCFDARAGTALTGLLVCIGWVRQGRLATRTARCSRQRVSAALGEGCAVYINLARRPDRRNQLIELLSTTESHLLKQLQRLDAIDGRDLQRHFDSDEVWKVATPEAVERGRRAERNGIYTIVHHGQELLHFNNHLTQGGLACAMSHRAALQAVASHPTADWGLILEDDVTAVVPRLDEAITAVLLQLPEDWEAVLLGYHTHSGQLARAGPDGFDDVMVARMISHEFGMYAWIVRKQAAQEVVDNAFPIKGQVDWAITRWLVQGRFRTYKVFPQTLLFHSPKSEESQDSDVQTMGSVERVAAEHNSIEEYNDHLVADLQWAKDENLIAERIEMG